MLRARHGSGHRHRTRASGIVRATTSTSPLHTSALVRAVHLSNTSHSAGARAATWCVGAGEPSSATCAGDTAHGPVCRHTSSAVGGALSAASRLDALAPSSLAAVSSVGSCRARNCGIPPPPPHTHAARAPHARNGGHSCNEANARTPNPLCRVTAARPSCSHLHHHLHRLNTDDRIVDRRRCSTLYGCVPGTLRLATDGSM